MRKNWGFRRKKKTIGEGITKDRVAVVLFLLLGLMLRVYGNGWDSGWHLHPDERMIIMVADKIRFFDNLDPNFFNYGSLPIYLLKGVSVLLGKLSGVEIANYTGMLGVGRVLSSLFDLGTVFIVYKLGRLVFDTRAGVFAGFFYAVMFFPIQNSNFYVTDPILSFFGVLLLYRLLIYLELRKKCVRRRIWLELVFLGVVSGLAIATKFSGVIFLGLVLGVVGGEFVLRQTRVWRRLWLLGMMLGVVGLAFVVVWFGVMPFAFLHWSKFWADISLQLKMNADPYIFPYTLQYVGTLPYVYYLKNMFLWGAGPLISVLAILGIVWLLSVVWKEKRGVVVRVVLDKRVVLVGFYGLYFLILGRSAVKFMRYLLVIYPLIAILAGYLLSRFREKSYFAKGLVFVIMLIAFLWSFAFVRIYSQKNTRVEASEWIGENIPVGSRIGVEHWDDRLPLFGSDKYKMVELTLYELPDDEEKWVAMNKKLASLDYLIIASNRLYVPLSKLADCERFVKCYPKTAEYYAELFNGERDFARVAEFSVSPVFGVPVWGNLFSIDDFGADESFTVYDHPRVFVFKRI